MSRRTQKNVGVLGLGIIGQRVSECLRRRGFHVFVWNRTPRPFPNFVGSPAELAELCELIQIFVADDQALLQMVEEIKRSLSPHHVIMASCTVAPATMREAADLVKRRGGQLLDAPFTGSKEAAGRGELVYYVAGDDVAYRRARPVLQASSKEIIEIGEVGQASTIKVATNMITAATVQAAAEALALVDSAGMPLEKFVAAMRSNGSDSGTLKMKLPSMISGNFETHFSVKHMLKDLNIASRLARDQGFRLGVTEGAREALAEEVRQGHGDRDYSAVVRQYFPEEEAPPAELALEERIEEVAPANEPEEIQEELPNESKDETEPAGAVEEQPQLVENSPDETGDASEEVALAGSDFSEEEEPAPVLAEAETKQEAAPVIAAAASAQEEAVVANTEPDGGERRGFLSRLFSKGTDY